MALITCPECSKSVSDSANACPNCGFPIQRRNPLNAQPIQQVELTAKRYKLAKLIGGFLIVAGIVLIFVAANANGNGSANPAISVVAFLAIFVGLIVALVASIASWWNHG